MRKGFSVALVGVDGAGKTSVARQLEKDIGARLRYMYMGCELDRSNFAVFTRRIARRVGQALSSRRRKPGPSTATQRVRLSTLLWTANLMIDELYRQSVSFYFQRKGYVVLYDRHFFFDYAAGRNSQLESSWLERIHRYFLANVYHRPDLVLYLRAPVDVLFQRKPEGDISRLKLRAEALEWSVAGQPNSAVIDVTQPLHAVCSQARSYIENFRPDADQQIGKGACTRDESAA